MNAYSGKFMFYNWALLEGAVITASEANVGDKVVDNLLDPDPDLTYSTDAFSVLFTITFPRPRKFDARVLHLCTLPTGAQLVDTLYLDSVLVYTHASVGQKARYSPYELTPYQHGGIGVPLGDEVDPYAPDQVVYYDATYLADELRIQITSTEAIQISHLMAGPLFSTELNFTYGSGLTPTLNSNAVRAPSGHAYANYDPVSRAASVQWGFMSDIESNTFHRSLVYVQKKDSPVFASLYQGRDTPREEINQFVAWVTNYDPPRPTSANENTTSINLLGVAYE